MTGGQTLKEMSEGRQPSTLRFINVAIAASQTRRPLRNAEEERIVRAHVMKDYLQQKVQPSRSANLSLASSSLSDHLVQFRLPARQEPNQTHRGIKKVGSASARKSVGMIMPKHEVESVKPLENDIFHNVTSPIDTSTPGTTTLLEYYHTSFWDNSLAANPEGQWLSVAVSDPAILHATLCLVALHKLQTRREREMKFFLWQRGEAMRLISKNLNDPEQATSDATIAAVAVLCASDDSVSLRAFINSPRTSPRT